MRGTLRGLASALFACLIAIASTCLAASPQVRAPPGLLQDVGFDQNLGLQVPLDAVFHEADGRQVTLRQLLRGKPVLLVPGYFGCKNLCGIVRTGVAHGIRRSGFEPGRQFDVLLVSIDPKETPADARTAQSNDALAHPGAGVEHWHYLTGAQASIAPLMRAIGFRYVFDDRIDQYAHAAGVVLLTPQGRITQYLFGVQFPPETLRLSLVSASRNQIGNIVDRLLLLCCRYDTRTGHYTLLIHHVMQGLGIGSALTLCGVVLLLRRGEKDRARQKDAWPT